MPGFAGHLHLTASRRETGATFLAAQSFRAPFHISKPYWDERVLQVQVVNPTAGILAGDRLEMHVRATEGARLCVTTPAATRAFMMRSGAAVCEQRLQAAAGSCLEYSPEPLFPHAGTTYVQRTLIEAAPDADMFWSTLREDLARRPRMAARFVAEARILEVYEGIVDDVPSEIRDDFLVVIARLQAGPDATIVVTTVPPPSTTPSASVPASAARPGRGTRGSGAPLPG